MAEQDNELIMKNHETHLVSFVPFPKVNTTNYNPKSGKDCGLKKKKSDWGKKKTNIIVVASNYINHVPVVHWDILLDLYQVSIRVTIFNFLFINMPHNAKIVDMQLELLYLNF